MGLGSCDLMTIAEAREMAADLCKQVRQGVNPREERGGARAKAISDRAKRVTFSEAVAQCLPKIMAELKNPEHQQQWRNTLATYAVPQLGERWVGEIEVQDVFAVLQPIWVEKTETATRVRSRIERILNGATVAGFRQGETPLCGKASWRNSYRGRVPSRRLLTNSDLSQRSSALVGDPHWG